ncbi:macrolide transport system ATP-binding/permease protein [Tistlia consotensis]|uniref:Pyoverdine export ATP-binding/permease protein PvdT n=1 Tax=Tistlia consotensis USBA 355 TaxID=560819 RepID=A0A1Y6BEF8_9PROT|nr:MacB family efflux pump subunit [Tistlia consotensis]SMF05316.1 macrolide transport system ATP-binding/permease protein [Tistlia consotensis USBA 355]SNR55236.1 macrolide transport system ATP-binding/permease protein [Tistlia consotensis]
MGPDSLAPAGPAAASSAERPLLEIRGLWREFPAGEGTIAVLRDVDLEIRAGEMVAIIGASGSGKSTLMNILGCLDRPTRGSYRIAGRDTGTLEPDELAELRREHFGFIFQRYHLLPTLNALGNVEVPAIYAGKPRGERAARARSLLERLGLGDRLGHRPSQLSGGQQQRVSVARALMNGGRVILADEPTGALDSESGREMMALLRELHGEGHTIIIVTHDSQVADHAERIIEISDGRIVGDHSRAGAADPAGSPRRRLAPPVAASNGLGAQAGRLTEAFRMALLAMASHRLRTFLTMLGIIIGIASVVSVVALGSGSQQRILEDISAIGTNTISIFPGKGFGDRRASRIETLVPADAQAVLALSDVDSVTPQVSSSKTLRYRNVAVTATIQGVGAQYFQVRGYQLAEGMAFTERGVERRAQEVVIDDNSRDKLFPDGRDPIGEVIFLGTVPCRVIGVTAPIKSGFGINGDALNVWVPYTTAMSRIIGQKYLESVIVRVGNNADTTAAEQHIVQLLKRRHGTEDFFTRNADTIRDTIQSTTQTMTLLISMIAVISLIVGGIGVMNIMLVSVTERTREIGVRMAVGARQGDILRQFLIEAILVCLIGGLLGVLLALGLGAGLEQFVPNVRMVYSTGSIAAAFLCSTAIGVIFGFLPARNAARLDPVEALARE